MKSNKRVDTKVLVAGILGLILSVICLVFAILHLVNIKAFTEGAKVEHIGKIIFMVYLSISVIVLSAVYTLASLVLMGVSLSKSRVRKRVTLILNMLGGLLLSITMVALGLFSIMGILQIICFVIASVTLLYAILLPTIAHKEKMSELSDIGV